MGIIEGFKGSYGFLMRYLKVPMGSLVGTRSYEALSGCKVVLEKFLTID